MKAAALVSMIVVAAWAQAGQGAVTEASSSAQGKSLFRGSEPMSGRIREHDDAMPASVLICSNCHALHPSRKEEGSDAPALNANFLNNRRSRRHGPVSAYDEHTFCRVLRTGMDPVYVLVDHTMPVYQVSDSQCRSLWLFLQQPDTPKRPTRPD